MIVEYIFRPKGAAVSIEKVFESVIKGVIKHSDITITRSWVKSFRLWPIGIIYNVLYYCIRSYVYKSRIFHITGDVQYVACLMNSQNTIMTIHDLVPLHNNKVPWYSRKLCYWLWYYIPLKRLRSITCISEATKQDLLLFFPWSANKISVVKNPVDDTFAYSPKDLNLQKPQILHIGTKENKNLPRVIEALDGHACHLRIVGKLNEEQQCQLEKSAVEYSNVWGISDEEIIQEYKDADIVSFPSTFEGFGMPIIESQAIGRPILTSNIEPMCSVAGDGSIIVNPYDIESIRKGFFAHTKDELKTIIEKGRQNAIHYSADNIANKYINLYINLCTIS